MGEGKDKRDDRYRYHADSGFDSLILYAAFAITSLVKLQM
jgi:hypothetical protein